MEDVIVIGGGPVGFISALGLAQAGVAVTIIEAEPQIIDSPRAAVYFWSVLGELDRLGILEEAEATGVRKQDYTYLVRRTGERILYSMGLLEGRTPHPYNLHLGQHLLAEIAMRRLKTLSNATVRFGARLQNLHQDADGVTVTVATHRETSGLFDSYALYPALAAVVMDRADDAVLDRYSAARRDIFVSRVSPQATANKQLIYHANGGGTQLEEGLSSLRRLATDPEFLWQRLMFTKSLETPPLLGTSGGDAAISPR